MWLLERNRNAASSGTSSSGSPAAEGVERLQHSASHNSPKGLAESPPVLCSPLLPLPGVVAANVQRPSVSSPISDWEAYILAQTQTWDEHRLQVQKGNQGRVIWADQVPQRSQSNLPTYVLTRDLNDSAPSAPIAPTAATSGLKIRKSLDLSSTSTALRGRKSFDSASALVSSRSSKASLAALSTTSSSTSKSKNPFKTKKRSSVQTERETATASAANTTEASPDRRASIHSLSSLADSELSLPHFDHFLASSEASAFLIFDGSSSTEQTLMGKRSDDAAAAAWSARTAQPRRTPSSEGSAESHVRISGKRPAFLQRYGLDHDAESDEETEEIAHAARKHAVADAADTTPKLDRGWGAAPSGRGDASSGMLLSLPAGTPRRLRSDSKASLRSAFRNDVASSNAADRPPTQVTRTSTSRQAPRDIYLSSSALTYDPLSDSSPPSPPRGSSVSLLETSSTLLPTIPWPTKGSPGSGNRSRAGSTTTPATTATILRSMPSFGSLRRPERKGSFSSSRSNVTSSSSISKRPKKPYICAPPDIPVPPVPTKPGLRLKMPQDDDKVQQPASSRALERESVASSSSEESSLGKHGEQAAPAVPMPASPVSAKVEGAPLAPPANASPRPEEKKQPSSSGNSSSSATLGTAQSEWDDLQIQRYLKSAGEHLDAARAVELLQRGELRHLLDAPCEGEGRKASPALLRDSLERLFLGVAATYDVFSNMVAYLNWEEQPVTTSVAAALYVMCWYRGMLLPLLLGCLAAISLGRMYEDANSDEHLRTATQAQRRRIERIGDAERWFASSVVGAAGTGTEVDAATQRALQRVNEAIVTLAESVERMQRFVSGQTRQPGGGVAVLLGLVLLTWCLSPWWTSRLPGLAVGVVVVASQTQRWRGKAEGVRSAVKMAGAEAQHDWEYAREALRRRVGLV
ncbi:hypothetical protein ACQY0O_003538 [Thecaphora frezii]